MSAKKGFAVGADIGDDILCKSLVFSFSPPSFCGGFLFRTYFASQHNWNSSKKDNEDDE